MATRTVTAAVKKPAAAADPAAPAKRTRNAEATKERILAVCMEVFSQSGFRGMRISEIAKLVGITEAGVLHHYPSKQALLEALLEYRERDTETLQSSVAHLHGLDALRALPEYAALITRNPVRAQLLLVLKAENLGREEFCGDYFRLRNLSTRGAIERGIREAQAAGDARSDVDPVALAREGQAFMDGIGINWLTDERKFDLVQAWTLYFEGLITRIAVPKTKRR